MPLAVAEVIPGLAFLNLSEHEHLCFVASPRDEFDNAVLLSVTTDRTHSDHTCEVAVGEHPFVVRPSVIAYFAACIKSAAEICIRVQQGKLKEAIAPALLRRAQEGAIRSRQTPREVKRMLRNAYRDL